MMTPCYSNADVHVCHVTSMSHTCTILNPTTKDETGYFYRHVLVSHKMTCIMLHPCNMHGKHLKNSCMLHETYGTLT